MFEGVRAVDSSWNRLALHRAKRSVDGVCDGGARSRRPSRRRVFAASAKENARRVPLRRRRGAGSGGWPFGDPHRNGRRERMRVTHRAENTDKL